MENLIDFSDPILRLVLPILLKDQTTGKNIIWANRPAPQRGLRTNGRNYDGAA